MPINYDSIFPGKQQQQQQAPPATVATSDGGGGAGAATVGGDGGGGDIFQGVRQRLLSYLPEAVTNLGAGIGQGLIRDPEMTLDQAGNWLARQLGYAPDPQILAAQAQTAAATNAYQQQQGGSTAAWLGRLGGNVAAGAAIPGVGVAGDVGSAIAGRLGASALRGAYAGGTGSALTSGGYGENPLTAGAEGALGGGLLGAGTAAVMRPVASTLTNIADRLGIGLSAGQKNAGGIISRLEDITEPFAGSGANKFGAQQQSQFANVVQRNMGVPETGGFTLPEAQAARKAAGTEMGNIAGKMSVDASAAAGAPAAPGGAAPNLVDRLNQIVTDAQSLGPNTEQAYGARNLRQQIFASLSNNNGVMPGADFQKLIGYGSTLDKMADHDNSAVKGVASDVRNALMTAVNNTTSNPAGILDNFNAARLKYKASVLATDVTKPTGDFSTVTPAALKQAIFRNYADQMGNTGAGYDLPDLARLIRIIPKFASSGTAQRQAIYNALAAGASYLGAPAMAAAGLHAAVPYTALIGAGRLSRFGPGMGLPYVGNALQAGVNAVNPLVPRLAGQGVGQAVTGNYVWPNQ